MFLRALTLTFTLTLTLSLPLSFFSQVPYFQQEVNYSINVKLDDQKHELFADARIEYINNSPDKLTFIWFHLWPNAYRNNQTALGKQLLENGGSRFYFAKDEDRGYIDGLDFKVNGAAAEVVYHKEWIDVCQVFLPSPIGPGEKVVITTPFHVKIPLGVFSRMGHIKQQYQITQWYPKPAVYDKFGWHPMPYLDQGEFYSEFGTFDVHITVPQNYVVGATGDLVNGEAEKKWLDDLAARTAIKKFDEKVLNSRGDSIPKYDDEFPASSTVMKTLHFRQSRVHDFAWFCDKRYNVLKGEVELPYSKRKVTTWVMFTNGQSKLWKKSIEYMNDAIYYYSLWNGDYPYNHATAVDGALSAGGGMEYPNITVIGEFSDPFQLETVIMHEVGHNWFYGILGSNERLHPWMDEGLNSFNEHRYIEKKFPNVNVAGGSTFFTRLLKLDDFLHKEQYYYGYMLGASRGVDQPVELHSAEYTQANYGGIVYSKTALLFDYLMAWLGTETMDKGMKLYFETWKFKHPYPEDLQYCLEKASGKDLSWFFGDVLKTTKKIDFKILSVSEIMKGMSQYIRVKNTGEVKAPVVLYGYDKINTRDKGPELVAWSEPIEPGAIYIFETKMPNHYFEYRIDPFYEIPEFNRNNNSTSNPVSLTFLGSLDYPEKNQLFWAPLAGWNYYNGFFAGAALYNNVFPEKKFQYILAPMFGFGNKELCGLYELALNFHPDKAFQDIRISTSGKRFAYMDFPFELPRNYSKLSGTVEMTLKKARLRSKNKHIFRISSNYILAETFTADLVGTTLRFNRKTDTSLINQAAYTFRSPGAVRGGSIGIMLEQSPEHMKLELKGHYSFVYVGGRVKTELRYYSGYLLNSDNNKYALQIAGANGLNDYLFSGEFLGRTEGEGVLSQQFINNNGGFRAASNIGRAGKWLAAVNLNSNLPYIPYLKVFADAGIVPASENGVQSAFQYDAGVRLSLLRGVLNIYWPLLMSGDIREYNEKNKLKGAELIRFTFELDPLNPFKIIRELEF